VENVGDGEITPALVLTNRVIPRGYANGVRLAPGQTGVIRVRFGYHWGAPTDEIDLQAVDLVKVHIHPNESGAFIIRSIRAVRN